MTLEELKQITDEPVLVCDEGGIITFVNALFGETFGWDETEAIGQPMTIIIPRDLHDAHNMGFARFLASESPKILNQHLTLKACNRAGEVFDADHFLIAEKIDGKWQTGGTVKRLD